MKGPPIKWLIELHHTIQRRGRSLKIHVPVC